MLDFTSALYLGLLHASRDLRPWARLTTGVPVALASPPPAARIAAELAELTGTERALLAPSTLHAFWDLFAVLDGSGAAIHMDAGTYPIGRWGVERAAARGTPVRTFRHHDPAHLRWQLKQEAGARRCPWVVADGLCAGCGGPAPAREYLECAREFGGRLILDDTQALGILGMSPGASEPYGRGGGGSMRWSGLRGPEILLISSLAKGFGVPAAMVGGSTEAVTRFEKRSETRVHCSPPSLADLRAAERALAVNRAEGDRRRLRLAALVRRLRDGLRRLGFHAAGSPFPVQSLGPAQWIAPAALHRDLLRLGIRTVLHRPACRPGPHVGLLITVRHGPAEIDRVLAALAVASAAQRVDDRSGELDDEPSSGDSVSYPPRTIDRSAPRLRGEERPPVP